MYNPQLYADGVNSVLKVTWSLRCETPLAVRNGAKLAFSDQNGAKERGRGLQLQWRKNDSEDYQVTALAYGYAVVDGQLIPLHQIPASTVRGALRSWTIRRFVESENIQHLYPESTDDDSPEPDFQVIRNFLDQRQLGGELIASLFGLAADARPGEDAYANAGRLRLSTEPFARTDARPVDAGGVVMQAGSGPDNVRRQMAVRNPLDRMTHASKEGGLHRFLEFSPGEYFDVTLSIRNPVQSDLGLLSLWARELNDGLLRVGALSSVGRGRVSIAEQQYELWRHPGLTQPDWLNVQPSSPETTDVMVGLWDCYILDMATMAACEMSLQEHIGGN